MGYDLRTMENGKDSKLEFSDTQIALMPLHTITEVLGHEGLARRFELEKAKLPIESQILLDKAYRLSMDLHADDKRYREPATNHLLRVAIRIMHHYGVDDPRIIAAALLHDSVEDHVDELTAAQNATKDEALHRISVEIDREVAELVSAVTNPDYDPQRDKLEQYQEHVSQLLAHGDPRAKIIKISDFTDNALGVKYMPTEGAIYRANRYLPLVEIFEKAITDDEMPLDETVKAHILSQLQETRTLLTGLLEPSRA